MKGSAHGCTALLKSNSAMACLHCCANPQPKSFAQEKTTVPTPTSNDNKQAIMEREAASSLNLNRLPYQIRYRLWEFTGAEFKVWMAHLSHAHGKDKRSFPSIALLIEETGLSEAGIMIARRGLVKKGWLVKYAVVDSKTKKRKSSTAYCKWPPPRPDSLYARVAKREEKCSDTVTS